MEKSKQSSSLTIDKQVCFSLYSASNAVIRTYQPMLKALDITYLQYIVMMVLWQYSSMNVKELGNKLHLDSGTLTPLLKRLELKGLLTRTRCKEDERVRIISITEEGAALQLKVKEIPNAMFCKTKMNEADLIQLKQTCDILLANLSK